MSASLRASMSEQPKKATERLAFIDWTRGLAAIIMLQGHTFNSFCRPDLRSGGPYMLSQFYGGLPPAIFLFLTGITFAFLMHSQERQGVGTKAAHLGGAEAVAIFVPDRIPVPDSTVCVRFPYQSGERAAQSRHPELHGFRDACFSADGCVQHRGADTLMHDSRLAHRRAGAGDQHDRWGSRALDRPRLSVSGLQLFRLLPMGVFPGVRHGGGKHSANHQARRHAAHDALDDVHWSGCCRVRLLLVEHAVLRVYEKRILAQQPWLDHDKARRRFVRSGFGVPLGQSGFGAEMESVPAIRHDVAAGLLGAHRTRLRPLVWHLERGHDGTAGRHLYHGLDRFDDGSFDRANALQNLARLLSARANTSASRGVGRLSVLAVVRGLIRLRQRPKVG